jgi:hypothetical protein
MTNEGCIVCGNEIKAKLLCAKHLQRYMRKGTVYGKGETVGEIDYDRILRAASIRTTLNLRKYV